MPERLTTSTLTDELRAQFNLEKGLLKTAVDLTLRPATMLMSYLEGTQRRNYVGVIAYLILSISVGLGIDAILGIDDAYYQELRTESPGLEKIGITDEEYWSFQETIDRNATHYVAYLYPPLAAVVTLWLFQTWGLTYVEHLVVNAFVIAHAGIISLPLYLAFAFLPFVVAMDVAIIGGAVVGFMYVGIVYFLLTQLRCRVGYLRDIIRSATGFAIQLGMFGIVFVLLLASAELAFIKWNAEAPVYEVPEHGSIPEALIGTWVGTDMDGSTITYTFDRDSSFQSYFGDPPTWGFEAKYLVRTDVEPMQMFIGKFSEDGELRQAIPFMQFSIDDERLTLCRASDVRYYFFGIDVGLTWLDFHPTLSIDCVVHLRQ